MAESKSRSFDVVGLGLCTVDYIALLKRYPGPDSKIEALETSIQGGGPVPTALCAASRLGLKTSFIGVIGDDRDGRFIADELKQFRVDTRYVRVIRGSTTNRAFIWADRTNGTRNVVLDKSGAGEIDTSTIPASFYKSASILHIDGRNLEADIEAAEAARSDGVEISLDIGSERYGSEDLLKLTDHLVVSNVFAYAFCDTQSTDHCLDDLRKYNFRSCVITFGDKGSCGFEGDGEIVRQRAYIVDDFVDSTGAGDVFHGAYLYGLISGFGLKERLEFASMTAALKCRRLGGRLGIPTLKEVEQFRTEFTEP